MSGTDQTELDLDELYEQLPPLSPEERERLFKEWQSTWTEEQHAAYARLKQQCPADMNPDKHLEWTTGT